MADSAVPVAAAANAETSSSSPRRYVSTTQAAFIGVGAMVGAGIFSLLGAAGEVAGAAVWLSFVLAGIIAALQGYSFAKFGARYPSAGGMLEYVNQAFGVSHAATITAWLVYAANGIVTAMVAVSFGSYATSSFTNNDPLWGKIFAVMLVVVMTALNIAGSNLVARVQSLIVFVVVGILSLFAVVTLANINPSLLAPADYPSAQLILSSVALTFFAFLGFGIVTFTAKDLENPSKQLPRAIFIAIGIATAVYVAVALGVFGTLTVNEVVESGATAIAKAAEPVLGNAGFWLMSVTALFATAGATNAGLYPAQGLSEHLASTRQFPAFMGSMLFGRIPVGLFVVSVAVILMAAFFDLSAIASIGSAVALTIFGLVTLGHLRVYKETGARLSVLVAALITTAVALLSFIFTTLINEPASIVMIVAIVVVSVIFDLLWSRPVATEPSAA
jgi:amino acid transporter